MNREGEFILEDDDDDTKSPMAKSSKVSTATDTAKAFKLTKKKTLTKKRKNSIRSKKSDLIKGYNEGAEEQKNSFGDSQSNFG